MTPNKYVFTKTAESKQAIYEDTSIDGSIIEPFIDFQELLKLYYVNAYHRRAIQIKAGILSQIAEHNLDRKLPAGVQAKDLLYAFAVNLELFGNAFLEDTGNFYILPTVEARLDKDFNIYQRSPISMEERQLEGHHLLYYSPASRYYGEPDYLAVFMQITLEQKINNYNNAFFDNGGKPDMAIIFEGSEPSDEQLASFRSFFETSFKGTANAHKTLIISSQAEPGTDAPKIKIEKLNEIEDMSFKTLKDTNRDEIIASHGVPPRLVGIVSSGQLGGGGELTGQLHTFNETVIKPKQHHIESFFKKTGCNVKLKPLDITDFKDDADVVTGLVSLGIITPQEAKNILGWSKPEARE
jgi:hypothetical protein